MSESIAVRWLFFQDGNDINGHVHAAQDADMVRAYEGAHGDFCLLELTRRGDRWETTGGDSSASWDPEFADRLYESPECALASLFGTQWHEAVCRCGDGRGEECD